MQRESLHVDFAFLSLPPSQPVSFLYVGYLLRICFAHEVERTAVCLKAAPTGREFACILYILYREFLIVPILRRLLHSHLGQNDFVAELLTVAQRVIQLVSLAATPNLHLEVCRGFLCVTITN